MAPQEHQHLLQRAWMETEVQEVFGVVLLTKTDQKPSAAGELLSGQASPQQESSRALLRGAVLLWGGHSWGWTLRFLLP